jgi:RNA polymerase sigma-70 factor (ECF subfamily)
MNETTNPMPQTTNQMTNPATELHDPSASDHEVLGPESASRLARLLGARTRLVEVVARRTGDVALAEDLVQEAFTRALTHELPADDEALSAWILRVLKNAAIDQARRAGTRARVAERLALELSEPDPTELSGAACRCVLSIADELKPEYRDALLRIEVDGLAVKDFAAEAKLTANNAAARVMRARRALGRELARACGECAGENPDTPMGCADCSCG